MSSQHNNLLVVDDEPFLRRTLRSSLSANGFAVEEARSGEEAIESVRGHLFDLVLLDINMPGIDGIDACRWIRSVYPQVGIIMITVRDHDEDKVRALEAGADDYVTKPFKFRELKARVRAVLRRTQPTEGEASANLEFGHLKIDLEKRLLWREGKEIHLSPKEFDLLAFMARNAGVPLTRVKLLRSIWGPEYGGELEYLRSYVRMLRKKIESDPNEPRYILTEPLIGYRFQNPDDPSSSSAEKDS